MNRESRMRQVVIRALAGLDPISVENPAHPGTPDVNCTGGWVELKCMDAWPLRETTPLRVPHFTPQQRAWLTRRWRADHRAWLLLRVGKHAGASWMLFDGEAAAIHVGNATRSDLLAQACGVWSPNLVASQLVSLLRP